MVAAEVMGEDSRSFGPWAVFADWQIQGDGFRGTASGLGPSVPDSTQRVTAIPEHAFEHLILVWHGRVVNGAHDGKRREDASGLVK